MVIFTDVIDFEIIKVYKHNPDGLVRYVEDLVPVWLRHVKPIVHNQRYYVAIHLRQLLSIPYKERESMVNSLVEGIRIVGVMNSFTTIRDILDNCDIPSLVMMLEESLNEER